MEPIIKGAIPVLPAADAAQSLSWWTKICGFQETFRDATPPSYAGINRGDAYLHISAMGDKELARKVGEQTMVRIAVQGIDAMYAEYQKHGGKVHPNGALQTKPWGTKEFAAIDPNDTTNLFGGVDPLGLSTPMTRKGALPMSTYWPSGLVSLGNRFLTTVWPSVITCA